LIEAMLGFYFELFKSFEPIWFLEWNKRLKFYIEIMSNQNFDQVTKHYQDYNHQTVIPELSFYD